MEPHARNGGKNRAFLRAFNFAAREFHNMASERRPAFHLPESQPASQASACTFLHTLGANVAPIHFKSGATYSTTRSRAATAEWSNVHITGVSPHLFSMLRSAPCAQHVPLDVTENGGDVKRGITVTIGLVNGGPRLQQRLHHREVALPAMNSGVAPSALVWSTAAPAFTSTFTTARWSFWAAMNSGVAPSAYA
jgi:hypothetical protein